MTAPQAGHGTGELHLGWAGGKICFGVGPVRLRFSREDAADLAMELMRLLEDSNCGQCGCSAAEPAAAEPAKAPGPDRFEF